MHRFFVPPEWISATQVRFEDPTARQISQVLRLKPGAVVCALDNRGSEYRVELTVVQPHHAEGRLIAQGAAAGEAGIRLSLYLCLTQREKFEWILQKCTELGVAAFAPVISARSLVQDARDGEKKLERWQRIVQEAAEQSGRGLIPAVRAPARLEQIMRDAARDSGPVLALWEGETALSLKAGLSAIGDANRLALLVGPEGGFEAGEMAQARAAGAQTVSLGRRILRMETAAVVATALVMDAFGEMG